MSAAINAVIEGLSKFRGNGALTEHKHLNDYNPDGKYPKEVVDSDNGAWPPTHAPEATVSHPEANPSDGEGNVSLGDRIRAAFESESEPGESDSGEEEDDGDKRDRKGKGKATETADKATGYFRPLTIGLEFEFLLGILDNHELVDPHPDAPQLGRHPIQGIETPPERKDYHPSHYNREDRIRDGLANFLRDNGHSVWTHGALSSDWYLKTDSSIGKPDFAVVIDGDEVNPYEWQNLELVTPAYIFNESTIPDIKDMLALLTSNFRTTTNDSCGLHMHVALGQSPLELHTLKRMLAFFWVFDPLLATAIHEKSRTMLECHHSYYCAPLRGNSGMADWMEKLTSRYYEPGTDPNPNRAKLVRPALARIMGAETYPELYKMVHKQSRFVAYNLTSLFDYKPGSESWSDRLTIEFRQHAGTLDQQRVEAWILTVTGIVNFCREADAADFSETLLAQAQFEEKGCKVGRKGRWGLHRLFRWVGIEAWVADLYLANRVKWRYPHPTYLDLQYKKRNHSMSSYSSDSMDSDEFEPLATEPEATQAEGQLFDFSGPPQTQTGDDLIDFTTDPPESSFAWRPPTRERPQVPERPRLSLAEEHQERINPISSHPLARWHDPDFSPYAPPQTDGPSENLVELPAELPGSPQPTVPAVFNEAESTSSPNSETQSTSSTSNEPEGVTSPISTNF